MVPPSSNRISRVPPYSKIIHNQSRTGLSPCLATRSSVFRLIMHNHWPLPLSLATTHGVSFDFFSSRYLDVSVPKVRLYSLCIQPYIPYHMVGCPIQTSTDHRSFAAPRRLSQRNTSFIASQCQGIHEVPFLRLIVT